MCWQGIDIACSNKWLLTGAWDATVKLWELKGPNGTLNSKPTAEFYDHENSVQAVAIDSHAEFAAAGADDGTVLIWNIASQSLIGNCQISSSRYVGRFVLRFDVNKFLVLLGRPISCLQWLPRRGAPGAKDARLLCGSSDGSIALIDSSGRLLAATKAEWPVRSLAVSSDGRAAFGGCEDGVIRVWALDPRTGALRELFRYPRAHEGACTALAMHNSLLASGGDDGAVRIWRIVCEWNAMTGTKMWNMLIAADVYDAYLYE
jgi:WD40 repeat protein